MKLVAVAILTLSAAACVSLPSVPNDNLTVKAQACGRISPVNGGVSGPPGAAWNALANSSSLKWGLHSGGKCATNGSTWRQVDAAQGAQRMNNNQPGGSEIPAS